MKESTIDFFYSAGSMGYGRTKDSKYCRFFHRFYSFPDLPFVTKTLTILPNRGYPWAVIRLGKSVYNKVALHNIGLTGWIMQYGIYNPQATVSIAGSDSEIQTMVHRLQPVKIAAIELNYSCPNVKSFKNQRIPDSVAHPLYLKLNYAQNPEDYDLDKISGIRLNSVPMKYGGGSGLAAKEKNWNFIKKYSKRYNIAGCSFNSFEDIQHLHKDLGCSKIGIGSTIITNPKLIEQLYLL